MTKLLKHILSLTAVLILCAAPRYAFAIKATDAFWHMPLSLCPNLTAQERLQLSRAVSNGKTDTINTAIGGKVWVESYDSLLQEIHVHIAQGVRFSIYCTNDSIMLVRTYCAPLCSSIVTRYNTLWLQGETILPPDSCILPLAIYNNGQIKWEEQYIYTEDSDLP